MQITLRRLPSGGSKAILSESEAEEKMPKELLFGSKYRRNGVQITRLEEPRRDRLEKYRVLAVPPALKWYPSTTANFIFGFKDRPPQWFYRLIPPHYNPAIWESIRHKGHLVLRVPKDRAEEAWKLLYQKGFWYNGAKNMWYQRSRQ